MTELYPRHYFANLSGNTIDSGKIYVGVENQDPETNPIAVYWDSARTIPATQPLNLSGGYILRSGARTDVYLAETAFSVRVYAKNSTLVDYIASVPNGLSGSGGSGQIGFSRTATYAAGTIGHAVQKNTAWTPYDFGAVGDGTTNDTAAIVLLAAQYFAGHSVHFPEGTFLCDADVALFTPPASYNSLNRRPPAITADPSARILARTGGTYLIKLGTLAGDYSGYLRAADFTLPIIDGANKAFTKAPLYVPFFFDIRMNHTVRNAVRLAWFGDTTAPAASAGLKGKREYERDLGLWTRPITSITAGATPTITFGTANALWPSSGSRLVCLNFTGSLGSWAAINNTPLDITFTGANTATISNVNSTGWGTAPAGTAYLNFASSRLPKQIAGVTNANPCVITTATNHLLTSGETVDVSQIFGMPTLIGQYVATVLSATTFSIPINTTDTAVWGAWGSFGPGWVEQWVPHASCDIGEYHDNATDIDDTELYVKHQRIGVFHNPSTCGWDGKKHGGHFYNFPEAGILRCAYYLGGDNNCVQVQVDGPFQHCFWAFGARNASTQCSTNYGGIAPLLNAFGTLVRTDSGASWSSHLDRLKSGNASYDLFSEHVGLGDFACDGTIWVNVSAPIVDMGGGKRAATVRFVGSTAAINSTFQTSLVTRSSAGLYIIDFSRPVPLESLFLATASGASGLIVTQDEVSQYASTTVYKRRVRVVDAAGAAADADRVSLSWLFPNYP